MDKKLILESNLNLIKYTESISRQFLKIVNPLLQNLPISTFVYWKLLRTGHYFILSNDLQIMQSYLNHHISDNQNYFLQEIRQIKEGSNYKNLWPLNDINKLPGLSLCHQLNIWHGMSITYNQIGYTESFIFAAPIECDKVLDLYLNHPYILERFITYFKNKAKHLIDSADPKIFAFSPLYQKAQIIVEDTNIDSRSIFNKECFKQTTDIKKLYLKTHPQTYLSAKEIESLYYLSLGKSAKEISSILNISHRTVEKHLDNIRVKCNVNFSDQLISLCKKNNIDKLHFQEFNCKLK